MWRTRLAPIAAAMALVLATASAVAALSQVDSATVPHGFLVVGSGVATPLDIKVGQNREHILADGSEVYLQHGTIAPGGSTGWHSHAGPVFVTIVTGALTLYDGDDPTCTGTTYSAGQGFIDEGFGHVHIARNEGVVPVDFYATYVLPAGSGAAGVKIPLPGFSNPACPF